MFEVTRDGMLAPAHHPFTRPTCTPDELLADPAAARAAAYDVVLNGYELGGGSLRIHDETTQKAVFKALHMEQEAPGQVRLSAGCAALRLPAPRRHRAGPRPAGHADDRHEAIRDVIAFPKTQTAACLMTAAPSMVDDHQLRELHILRYASRELRGSEPWLDTANGPTSSTRRRARTPSAARSSPS
jgi:aspartyl-tRNA synthetase